MTFTRCPAQAPLSLHWVTFENAIKYPLARVQHQVIGVARADDQILVSVIQPIAIDMVNTLACLEGAAEDLFGDNSMFMATFQLLVL